MLLIPVELQEIECLQDSNDELMPSTWYTQPTTTQVELPAATTSIALDLGLASLKQWFVLFMFLLLVMVLESGVRDGESYEVDGG